MALGRRRDFVQRWLEKARKAEDPFDRFFYAWIALVAAAQRQRTQTGIPFREIYADREKVLEYFAAKRSNVLQVLKDNRQRLHKLACRKGARFAKPVIDTRSLRLRGIFSDFSAHYTHRMPMTEEQLVEATGEVINKIRINLFQGTSDDSEDIELLELVNPILLQILESCESR
ncbi:MAG: hypothetical protein AB1640_10105 [bacterium]